MSVQTSSERQHVSTKYRVIHIMIIPKFGKCQLIKTDDGSQFCQDHSHEALIVLTLEFKQNFTQSFGGIKIGIF